MAVATIEAQRQQLARLYVAVIAADGPTIVHQLLSRALVEHRSKAKKKSQPRRKAVVPERKPSKPRGPMTIVWNGRTLALGDAMRRLNSRQQLFVLAVAHDNMATREAEKAAGYSVGGSPKRSPYIDAAIAEERARVM